MKPNLQVASPSLRSETPHASSRMRMETQHERLFDEDEIVKSTKVSEHDNKGSLDLLVIRGTRFMSLVHALYERAANEA